MWESSAPPETYGFWKSGQFQIGIDEPGEYGYKHTNSYKYFGLRFDPAGIRKLLPKHPTTTGVALPVPESKPEQPPQLPQTRAGRPPKDFWEDMIIAASKAFWFDDTLQPKTQADVQRWLAKWADDHGCDPGETALKERARKLYMAFQEQGRK